MERPAPVRPTTRRRTPHSERVSLVERAAGQLGLRVIPDPDDRAAHAAVTAAGEPRPSNGLRGRTPEATAAAGRVRLDRDGLRTAGLIDPGGGRRRLAEEFRIIKRPLLARVRARR